MKHIIILIAILIAPVFIFGQQEMSVRKFSKKYKKGKESLSIKVPGWLARTTLGIAGEPETKKLLKGVRNVRVTIVEQYANPIKKEDMSALMNGLKNNEMEPLLTVREKETNIDVYVQEKDGIARRLFLLVEDESDMVLLNVKGKMKTKQIVDYINDNSDDFFIRE